MSQRFMIAPCDVRLRGGQHAQSLQRGRLMFINPQQFGRVGFAPFETATAALSSATQGFWAVTTEATGYSQKSVANAFAFGEKLSRAQKLDEIIQLNSDFAKLTFDEFAAEVTKIGGIYANVANQTLRVAKEGLDTRPLEEAAANAVKSALPRKQETPAANSN
jgi:hypothetical protein